MTQQPTALRLAEWFEKGYGGCELEAAAELRRLHEDNMKLREELDDERMRHAACGVVAMSNTRESAERNRKMLPKYWSASVQDVAKAVDREMEHRDRITTLEAALRQAVEALEQIAAYRPLTFAECSDAEAVMGLAENASTAANQALEGKA